MKLLTRYPSSGLSGLRPAACLQAVRDGSSTPAPKRASFLVRLPYYVFLASMAAVYYGYVISLNLRWMILHQGYIWLSFVFLSIFHFLFVMFMWSLLATVYRGPGAVGEVLTLKTGNNEDLEAGLPNESAPLMQNIEDPSSDPVNNASHHALAPNDQHTQPPASRWRQRPRSSSKSHSHTSTEDEDDAANQDYLELQPKLDYGDSSDEELEAGTSNSSNAKKKKDVEIIYPGTLGSRASLMAKANGKARFCRKCNVAKPDRAHHCSTCGFCVLKMDHHCPWIGGCVGFKNYKTFILFLFYADLLSIFTCATSLWVLIQVLDMDIEDLGMAPVGWGFLVLFGFLFAVMLTGFFPYHLYLAVNNRSTIENMERNGRLLSLPSRAETMLSAGVPDPHTAGLPERSKTGAGQHLLSDNNSKTRIRGGNGQAQPPPPGFADSSSSHRPQNPFLPSNESSSVMNAHITSIPSSSTNFESSALSSLSRMQKKDLERKAEKINIYDLGSWQANFKETFGSEWNSILAWIPIGKSSGSGYDWPINKKNFDRLAGINAQLRLPNTGI